MKTLWEYDAEHVLLLVQSSLSDLGQVSSKHIETPYSRVFTIDAGANKFPRYLIAKAPWFDAANSDSRLEKLVHEVEQTAKIAGHPYLHRFGKIRYVHRVPFLISAKRDGTLDDILSSQTLDLKDSLAIGIQICRGLGYCQHAGLVAHQDLKPANIFVDDLAIKFGPAVNFRYLARVADFELSNAYLTFGKASGSRPYMSPEQHLAESGKSADLVDFSKSDTFSFGIILHELVTGGMHPVGERTSDIWPAQLPGKNKWKRSSPWVHWIQSGAPMSCQDEVVPECVRGLLGSCLKTTPQDRPSIGEVELQLWGILGAVDVNAARALEMATRDWEEGLHRNPLENWPAGQEMLNRLRKYFADRA